MLSSSFLAFLSINVYLWLNATMQQIAELNSFLRCLLPELDNDFTNIFSYSESPVILKPLSANCDL